MLVYFLQGKDPAMWPVYPTAMIMIMIIIIAIIIIIIILTTPEWYCIFWYT